MAYKDPLDPRAREARRRHYHNNKEQYKQRARERDRQLKVILAHAKSGPCQDCGNSYPTPVMELHHRDPTDKVGAIATLVRQGASIKRLMAEIDKCDLLCANCHRLRTYTLVS